jgi:lipopolysaccharide transport system ATP-binding protein
MHDVAVRVEHLGKRYRTGTPAPYRTVRETLVDALRVPWRRRNAAGTVWALDDVSFDVAAGEIVGVIGRNGAGKTTLLKILSRVTGPTRGVVHLRGRVGALLEVGAGFHPELTGRENVYLYGAILGMRRAEIRRKFDEIVTFAEVARFLDTPVKRFSSGMYARLAFAVAAHLEPEILIADEVLAVGDASFQRRCLQKMESVAHDGRTVLFVSHNMPAVTRLCPRTLLLDAGRIVADGPSHAVVGRYLRAGFGTTAERRWDDVDRAPGNEVVRLRAVRVRGADGRVTEAVDIRRPLALEIEFVVLDPGHRLVPNFHVANEDGVLAFITNEVDSDWHRRPRPAGRYVARACVPGNLLAEGTMVVTTSIATVDPVRVHLHEADAVAFQVVDSLEGDSARGDYGGTIPGVVRPLLRWETQFEPLGPVADARLRERA